jgi:hypothetical protein
MIVSNKQDRKERKKPAGSSTNVARRLPHKRQSKMSHGDCFKNANRKCRTTTQLVEKVLRMKRFLWMNLP